MSFGKIWYQGKYSHTHLLFSLEEATKAGIQQLEKLPNKANKKFQKRKKKKNS